MHAIEIRKRSEYIPIKTKILHDIILSYPFVAKFASCLTGILGQKRVSKILSNFTLKDINFFGELLVKRKSYMDEFEEKLKLEKIDAIILPTFGVCAFK